MSLNKSVDSTSAEKALTQYEEIMQIKLSIGQRMIFTAGYNFALINNNL